jgi:hypothetical protein
LDQPDLLGLFAQLVREEFGLELPKQPESAADPKLDALLDAFASALPATDKPR